MGVKIGTFATDSKKSVEGVWVPVGAGLELLVARAGNPANKKLLRKLLEPYKYQVRRGTLGNEVMEDIDRQAISRTILLGWKNLDEDDGAPMVYSPQKALDQLTKHSEFYALVVELSNNLELYKQDDLEDAAKNSESASAGS